MQVTLRTYKILHYQKFYFSLSVISIFCIPWHTNRGISHRRTQIDSTYILCSDLDCTTLVWPFFRRSRFLRQITAYAIICFILCRLDNLLVSKQITVRDRYQRYKPLLKLQVRLDDNLILNVLTHTYKGRIEPAEMNSHFSNMGIMLSTRKSWRYGDK